MVEAAAMKRQSAAVHLRFSDIAGSRGSQFINSYSLYHFDREEIQEC